MAKNQYSEDEFLYIKAYTEEALKNMKIHLIEGRLPENENEIVLSTTFFDGKENEPKIGDTITLEIGKRMSDGYELIGSAKEENETFEKIGTKTYLVCGKIQRPDFEKSTDNYTSGVTFLNEEKPLTAKTVDIGVISKNVKKIYKDTEEIAEKLGLHYENALGKKAYDIQYNEYVLAFKGVSSTNGFNEMLYTVCGILITVIMVGSILVIYNSFAISVSERKKQFGMLASIGATKKQIKKSVIYEGAILGSIGIPIGILSGIGGIGITLNVVNELLKPMFEAQELNWSLHLEVSWGAIIIAAILIGITIYLSVMIPAKRASKASPIETIRGNNEQIKSKKLKTPKIIRKFFGIEGEMALKNLKRSRKKYRTTVISLMISIILFVSVSGFVDYMYSGFDVMYQDVDYDYKIMTYGAETENEIRQKEEMKNQLENSNNIDKLTISESIHGYTILQEENLDINMRKHIHNKKEIEDIFSKDENGYNIVIEIMTLTNKQMSEYLNQFGISSLKDNQGILINYSNMIRSAKIEGNITSLKDKDNLKVNIYNYDDKNEENGKIGTKEQTFEIAKVTDKMPFGVTNMDIPKLILIVNEDAVISKEERYTNIVFTAKNEQELKEELKQIESEYSGLQLYVTNVKENMQSQRNLKMIINIFLYGFIALISSIGVANIFNTISTNINLRKREFAMLKSIGMTDKGFKKMLNLECFFYGTKALLLGLPIGVLICYLINKGFGNMIEFMFSLPWSSIIISIVSVYLVVFITMIYSSSKIKKENIIDVLRDENI